MSAGVLSSGCGEVVERSDVVIEDLRMVACVAPRARCLALCRLRLVDGIGPRGRRDQLDPAALHFPAWCTWALRCRGTFHPAPPSRTGTETPGWPAGNSRLG